MPPLGNRAMVNPCEPMESIWLKITLITFFFAYLCKLGGLKNVLEKSIHSSLSQGITTQTYNISWNFNKIYEKIVKQYVRAKFVGFKM